MERILIIIGLVLMGLVIGSFCGAMVWRLRARQLQEDKDAGEKIDQKEYSRLKKILNKSTTQDRSMCLYCHHQLVWYDLLPLVSWVALGGKCRYCRRPIGRMEPLIELGMAMFFVVSYVWWPLPLDTPLQLVQLGLWLVAGVGLVILTAYDMRWFLLPNRVVYPLLIVASVSAVSHIIQAPDVVAALLSLVSACMILSGLYFVLYLVSKGAWIGFGDIKLGLVLALLVADWQLAFLTLFLANVIGCLIVLPGLGTKKFNRYTRIPFGPMLIVGCFVAMIFGERIITWYLSSFSLI